MRGNVKTVLAAVLAALALVAAGGVAAGVASPSPRSAGETTGSQQARATAERIGQISSAFDRAPSASDRVPPGLVRSRLLDDDVADVAFAKRMRTERPTWVLPGTDAGSTCLLTEGGLACAPTEQLAVEGLVVSVGVSTEGILVSGVAADGVTEVSIVWPDGSTRDVPIAGNELSIEVGSMPSEIRWTGPNGSEAFVLPARARN